MRCFILQVRIMVMWVAFAEIKFILTTVESRFFEPPGEKKIGSNYREVRKIGGKITVFDLCREICFGSNYREV